MTDLLFEPWQLGDAVIASSVLRVKPEGFALVCFAKYHRILRALFPETQTLRLCSVDLPYTRHHADRISLKGNCSCDVSASRVYSIRGDLRDYMAARRFFPGAAVRMTGWLPFFARRSHLLNYRYASGRAKVRNRYVAWAEVTGVPFSDVEASYANARQHAPKNQSIALYVGSGYLSRQYPFAAELMRKLQEQGFDVSAYASKEAEADNAELEAEIVVDEHVVSALKKHQYLISNDTGPMHVGAALGCTTFMLAHMACAAEWLPPGAHAIVSDSCPRGYHPAPAYTSDEVVPGWPSPGEVVAEFQRFIRSGT